MGAFHPQVVHFAIALLVVGVLARALSLLGKPAFVGPMATTLLALGTVAVAVAAFTGDAAHGPVEQMPGLRPAVMSHEAWGERARNVFFIVFVVEALALAARNWSKVRYLTIASTVIGAIGLFVLYEAGEHGGQIVYGYAGGVGIRGGDPADVKRLLLAGLYQQALVERRSGRAGEAFVLIDDAARRFPEEVDVRLLRADSLLVHRHDASAALEALRGISPPADNRFQRIRHAMLTADALLAANQRDGALAILQQLQAALPSPRVQQRIEELQGKAPAPTQ